MVRWIEFAGGKQAATGIFSLPGRYMRTGHSARTHKGNSGNSGTGYSIPLFSSVALLIEPTELGN